MLKCIFYMKEFAITSRKNCYSGEKNYQGNKLCLGICLNSFFLSISHILGIYAKKHKVLWNINVIIYCGIPFMVLSQKNLDCAHGIDQKAELKKKKRTRKDTENVRCLILQAVCESMFGQKFQCVDFVSRAFGLAES